MIKTPQKDGAVVQYHLPSLPKYDVAASFLIRIPQSSGAVLQEACKAISVTDQPLEQNGRSALLTQFFRSGTAQAISAPSILYTTAPARIGQNSFAACLIYDAIVTFVLSCVPYASAHVYNMSQKRIATRFRTLRFCQEEKVSLIS